jgi:CRP-like cAMP-binding protein
VLAESANHLLQALPDHVETAVLESLERVELAARTVIYEPGAPVRDIYLPIDCVISVVKVMRSGTQIEVFTVGREGLTGSQALLDRSPANNLTYVQIPGAAYRIPFEEFERLFSGYMELAAVVERYMSAQVDVLSQSIACNRLHYVSERCARWLLLTHDRIGRTEFPLTHEALATMLGVRRAGVSIAAATLQQSGCISYSRGRFTIADRDALVDASCECYGAINEAYTRLRLPYA